MSTVSATRRALSRKARRAQWRRQVRAAVAEVAREERAAAEPGEVVEVRYVPRSLARTLPARPLPRPVSHKAIEFCQLASDRPCPCGTCAECRRIWAEQGRDVAPGEVPGSPESWAVHEHETAREIALWHALVWEPEAAAEAAHFRPDDRPRESAWARLRLVLEALGVLPSQHDHGPPVLGGVVVSCHPRTGPPGAWSASEALVISP